MLQDGIWFINEDGVAYDWKGTVAEQVAQYPGDFHTPFNSEAEANAWADENLFKDDE